MDSFAAAGSNRPPQILTVPGLGNSGAAHWQTIWEQTRGDCRRIDLGNWDDPTRSGWVNRLDAAIRQANGPVILVAHSLGCLAVAWWGALQSQPYGWPVAGALLVAPPDCDRAELAPVLGRFGPVPKAPLPFPSILVASHDDPYIVFERAWAMGRAWGSRIVDAGHCGHINADSDLGVWRFGQGLLDRLVDEAEEALSAPRAPYHIAPPPGGRGAGAQISAAS